MKPSVRPPSTKRIGYGISVNSASTKRAETATSTPSTTSSVPDESAATGRGMLKVWHSRPVKLDAPNQDAEEGSSERAVVLRGRAGRDVEADDGQGDRGAGPG